MPMMRIALRFPSVLAILDFTICLANPSCEAMWGSQDHWDRMTTAFVPCGLTEFSRGSITNKENLKKARE